ncbi:hypothetical protein QF048_006478 [Streptomyces sp. W4I9-2]|nr:hypothetical protein [Streptomyces sp. W4I9-2]
MQAGTGGTTMQAGSGGATVRAGTGMSMRAGSGVMA